MTESDWLASTDPEPMLEYRRGKVSDRKLRLFAAACCRRLGHLLADPRSRATVELVEQYADGGATEGELFAVRKDAQAVLDEAVVKVWADHPAHSEAACMARNVAFRDAQKAARETVLRAAAALAGEATGPCTFDTPDLVHHITWREAHRAAWDRACRELTGLLRDILGNPFRPAHLDPPWLVRNDVVVALARTAYQERTMPEGTLDPTRLAVLADALEDAGCTDADILAHCRGPGTHVRGYWVIDRILGKE